LHLRSPQRRTFGAACIPAPKVRRRPRPGGGSYSPSARESAARSKPTIVSSPTTVTGVVMVPMRSNSSKAASSSAMLRSVNSTPFSRRNFSVLPQNSQPGCTNSTTSSRAIISLLSPLPRVARVPGRNIRQTRYLSGLARLFFPPPILHTVRTIPLLRWSAPLGELPLLKRHEVARLRYGPARLADGIGAEGPLGGQSLEPLVTVLRRSARTTMGLSLSERRRGP
jgi:hypothetical protein